MENYFTAIIFDANKTAKKFRNIRNSRDGLNRFEKFAKDQHKAVYVNYYGKKSRVFQYRSALN